MTFIHLMKRLSCPELQVQDIADAYRTPSRTRLQSSLQATVSFDAILDVKRRPGPISSWHIESKGGTTIGNAKFVAYFERFVVNAYGVLDGWTDPIKEHTALFVFLSNRHFSSPLYDDEQLQSSATRAALKRHGIRKPREKVLASLVSSVRVLVLHDWFQS